MVFFITVLRALAACLITNAHYTGIYPTDIIANGGLIGDILFFAVSGYCLCNVKQSFHCWYGKRLWRIFLPVWIGTSVLILLGGYDWDAMSWFEWLFYPTYYHFVASIVVLYIPFYFTVSFPWVRNKVKVTANIVFAMLGTALIMALVYFIFYDRSYYHIDVVREPFIRFLFFESMLLGAYFKQNDVKFRNSFSPWHILGAVISFVLYFASKLAFSKYSFLSDFQIVNQFLIFVLLYFIFRLFIGIDAKLELLHPWIKRIIAFIAEMTLEIYIVQYVLIEVLRPYFHFPLNWFIITLSIVLSALILHYVCKLLYRCTDNIYKRILKMREGI